MSSNITVTLEASKFHIYCPFSVNNLIRVLPNRRWSKPKGCWVAPILRRNVEAIEKLASVPGVNIIYTKEARERIQEVKNNTNTIINRERFPMWYKFKGTPLPHQLEALDVTYSLDTTGYLMDMGTGKSYVLINRATCAFMGGRINAVVIMCPASVKGVWVAQYENHCPIEYNMLVFDTNTTPKTLAAFLTAPTDKMKILVAAVEGLQVQLQGGKLYVYLKQFLLHHNAEFVIDESDMIKGHDSNRAENCVKLSKFAKRRVIMTGTPMSQGPTDLYMQFEFLNPEIISIGDFRSFRNRYCIMGGYKDKSIIGYDNLEELTDLIKPWIYECAKSEVLDLPEKLYTKREVTLSKLQAAAYKEMVKESAIRIKDMKGVDLDVVAENVLTEYAILQEITGGFLYYTTKSIDPITQKSIKTRHTNEVVPIAQNAKIQELLAVVAKNPTSSVIIWARFTYEIESIAQALTEKYGPGCCSVYYSGSEDYAEETRKFNSKETRFMVANQASGATGNTWVVSNLTIYFSNTFVWRDREQSEDRNHRIGQKNAVLYVDLVATGTVDEDILQSLADKTSIITYVKSKLAKGDIESLFHAK